MKETKKEINLLKLLKKLGSKPRILKNLERPKGLPEYAPDCGFNHGKPDNDDNN